MHRLTINSLGPIDHIEIEIGKYTVLTGAQASGKSTIAKTIFYFRTIKNDIQDLLFKKTTSYEYSNSVRPKSLNSAITTMLREKFLNVFGSSWSMNNSMYIEYKYSSGTFIKVCLVEDNYNKPNYIKIELSEDIKKLVRSYDKTYDISTNRSFSEDVLIRLKIELSELFTDVLETTYIPAGRSMITLLASQLNYFYISMDNVQRNAIDYCTRSYIENIVKIRPEFESGLIGLSENFQHNRNNRKTTDLAEQIISKILHGSYSYNNGEERLYFNSNRYVKMNFASSGQQESVWILNLLYYSLLKNNKTFFIIEEPESHLFPEAQKLIMDLISLVANSGNNVLVTTHSPYVLGAINNQLFASRFTNRNSLEASRILNKELWINLSDLYCYFVEYGGIKDCIDPDLKIIDNTVIDGISAVINEEFDELNILDLSVERNDE